MRHRQHPIGNLRRWAHGTVTGYKNHACRCQECSRAHAEFSRALWVERQTRPQAPSLTSWWITPDGGMSAAAQKEHARMRSSVFGGMNKPFNSGEA